jgi:hypothetical protein
MLRLHLRLIQLIQSFGDTKSQVNVLRVSKSFNQLNLTIITIGKPNDDILFKYAKFIHILDADYNPEITDAGIKTLVNLHALYAGNNSNVTDASAKNLVNLRTLYAGYSSGITDVSIKNLVNLCILYAHGNQKTTIKISRNQN